MSNKIPIDCVMGQVQGRIYSSMLLVCGKAVLGAKEASDGPENRINRFRRVDLGGVGASLGFWEGQARLSPWAAK